MDDSSYYSQEQSDTVTGTESATQDETEDQRDSNNEEETKTENPEEEEPPKLTEEQAYQKVMDMLHDGTIVFPEEYTDEELRALLEPIEFPQEISNESIEQYHNECVQLIKEELVPDPEKPDEEDEESFVRLTPQFIADRLSDLQSVEGEHLSFAFTSFGVQEADIYDISALSEYQALTYIKLKTNIISDASALNGLPRLRELYLNENKIVSFTGISLPSLEILDLSSNQLRSIGHLSLPKLQKLILSQNKICYVAPTAFQELTELNSLILTENKIKSFKPNVFKTLSKLETLLLDQNQILNIPEELFDGLTGLKKLNLNENGTETIPGLSLLTALETLELQQSGVQNIDDIKPLIDLKALKSINLDGSPVSSADNFRSDVILMLPWIETIDEEAITFSERQEALQLDEERKAEAERERLEREAAERATSEETDQKNEEEDRSDTKTEETNESYSTYYESDAK